MTKEPKRGAFMVLNKNRQTLNPSGVCHSSGKMRLSRVKIRVLGHLSGQSDVKKEVFKHERIAPTGDVRHLSGGAAKATSRLGSGGFRLAMRVQHCYALIRQMLQSWRWRGRAER